MMTENRRLPGPRASAALGALLVSGLLLLTAACGSEDSEEPPEAPVEPRLSSIEQQIFQRSCAFSSCHGGEAPKKGLLLEGPTYTRLVNQPSAVVKDRVLVVPGNPGASYLYEKLTSSKPADGDQMPDASTPLSAAKLEAVRAWIAAGAKND
jgi:mono/diheme cytochrome c family protein